MTTVVRSRAERDPRRPRPCVHSPKLRLPPRASSVCVSQLFAANRERGSCKRWRMSVYPLAFCLENFASALINRAHATRQTKIPSHVRLSASLTTSYRESARQPRSQSVHNLSPSTPLSLQDALYTLPPDSENAPLGEKLSPPFFSFSWVLLLLLASAPGTEKPPYKFVGSVHFSIEIYKNVGETS